MDIVVDLNILRGDRFPNIENSNYIIPLLLLIELFNSDSISEDGKYFLLQKIIKRNYKIDTRHPRTIFCNCVGQINKDQKVYDLFVKDLISTDIHTITKWKDLIEWNKQSAKDFDNSFTSHDFSKVLRMDEYRDLIKNPDIPQKELEYAIINEIKNLLVEKFLSDNKICFEHKYTVTKSLDVYFSIMAYYHYISAKNGRSKHNDFTDINYMLYLDNNRRFYSLDKKLNKALSVMKPELILTPHIKTM